MSQRDSIQEKKLKRRPNPVISESILDAESQKYYVWAIFILIQAWKFYDLYLLHSSNYINLIDSDESAWINSFSFLHPKLSFIFKYVFFDSLLILLIPFLNIPNLTLTPNFIIFLLCSINILTVILTSFFSFTFSSIIYSIYRTIIPEKELAIMETYVDSNSIINQSDHFKGKKTIRYAPDSSIKINPFDQLFCIRPIYNDEIKLPIRLESTYDLKSLQINYHDMNNDIIVLNYTLKDLKSFIVSDYYNSPYIKYDPSVLAQNNVQILEIPIEKPGYYSIKSATDKKDKMIRSFKSNTVIPVCPDAAFITKNSFTSDKCIDQIVDDLEITLLGVPPFTLFYEEEIDGELSKLPPIYIPHVEKIDSPLNSKEFKKNKYSLKYLSDISWAKSYNITIPIGEKKLQKSGNCIYSIKTIIDGFGNTVSYNQNLNEQSTFYSFYSHPKLDISLQDPQPSVPILIDHEKYLNIKVKEIKSLSLESPLNVTFKYFPNENDESYQPETFSKLFDLNSVNDLKIRVDKPGTYLIDQASSKHCDCRLGPSSLNILTAKLPNMNVTLDPIIDNCVGTIGFKFNFDFVGNAPFSIGYKISKLDTNDSNKVLKLEKSGSIVSESTTFEYIFKPSSEGSYAMEFTTLGDKFYKGKTHFEKGEYRYITYFKQKPKAYFNEYKKVDKLQCCHGATSKAKLHIEGKPPFNVTYDIISPDYDATSYSLKNIYENEIDIITPKFFKGGDHILTLKSVRDSTSCDVEFKGQEIHIEVKNDVPQLSFQKDEKFEIVKGKIFTVPLKTQSHDKIDLIYSFISLFDGSEKILKLNNFDPLNGLKLSNEGKYKLISFKQGGCPGKITNDYSIEIRYIPVPTLNIINENSGLKQFNSWFEKSSICQNQNDHVTFQATGSTPFIIKYDIKYPDGKIEEKVEQINNSKFILQLVTNIDGEFTYTIKNIYDSVYKEEILDTLERENKYKFEQIMIKQPIYSLPGAKFIDSSSKIQTCASLLDEPSKLSPINVELEGALPISLKIDICSEYDGVLETVEFSNLDSHFVNLMDIYQNIDIGLYVLSIIQVSDANGCTLDEHSTSDNSFTIQVHDVPKIRHLVEESNQLSDFDVNSNGNYYCVGDQITFMLNGIPPFMIEYEFNSVSQKVEIQGNYFKRRAPGPGFLNINSLSDSSAKGCKVEYDELNRSDLKATIHDLPSVEIFQGDSIEEDIHEGEQIEIIFFLTGTPPFRLTYIRKELDDSTKIVETEIVEDIISNEYRILANLEGTYEAIEIQDRYCIARNHKI